MSDPFLDISKTTFKTSSGKSLKLSSSLSYESNQSSKIKKINTHDEARQYLEQCDLDSPEIKEIYSHTAAAKNPNIPNDILKNMSDSAVKGEINFVEVMGPKQTSESPVEFFSVFADSDVGLGPDPDECGICTVASMIVKCEHGRSASVSAMGVLQVVAKPVDTESGSISIMGISCAVEKAFGGDDQISATLELDSNKFQKCHSLTIEGDTTNESSKSLVLGDTSGSFPDFFNPNASAKKYSVVGSSCTESRSVSVEVYPNTICSGEFKADIFNEAAGKLNDAIKDACESAFSNVPFVIYPKITLPNGSLKASWGWEEDSNWEAFYGVQAEFGFNPLFGVSVEFELSLLQVAGMLVSIPPVITRHASEHIADIIIFSNLGITYSFLGSPKYKLYTDGRSEVTGTNSFTGEGKFTIGLKARVGSDKFISVQASIYGEASVTSKGSTELSKQGLSMQLEGAVKPFTAGVSLITKVFFLFTTLDTEYKDTWTPFKEPFVFYQSDKLEIF